jgi:CubicO group peptidase (beta-lactamase class C family)
MRLFKLFGGACAAALLFAGESYPPAHFTDPQRIQKLESALPQMDEIFKKYAADQKIPGMVWGLVIDGQLVHVSSSGVRDRATGDSINAGTVFRIASMTKSFTALSILKLRDEGKLSLEDPVWKWIPEFAASELPTRDSAPIRVRQLLSHSTGFPEDNPWADQQLAASEADVTRWLKQGIPFSTPPGTRYEYSNYMWGLLGRIVSKASGMPYRTYVKKEILDKLHMDQSTLDFASVPAASRAVGYRLKPDGTYQEELPLPDGAFGSAGGLLTNATDMGKYVAFQLSAWPPRDDPETGPVRRSSVREMNQLWRPSNLIVTHTNGALQAAATGYGFGLRIRSDCHFELVAGHGGGLPGFGSYMTWLPDYGVGMFAMATLTYSGPSEPINQSFDVFLKTGGLQKRELPPSPMLIGAREHILNLWKNWDDAEAKKMASMNLLIDEPPAQRQDEIRKLKEEVGECSAAGPVIPENWLRGQFNMTCERGTVGVFYTMSPTKPPAVQHLKFQKLANQDVRLGAPTGPPAGVSCLE